MPPTSRHPRSRRWLARTLVMFTVVVTATLGMGTVAFANGTFSTSAWAGCSKAWNSNTYGGEALAHETYTATTSHPTYAEINSGHSWVDTLEDCGPGGYGLTAYSIELTTQFKFKGTSLSCSAGIPLSFSCTVSGGYEYGTYSTTCSANVPSCSHTFGTLYFYAPANGAFSNVAWMQTTVTLRNSSGNAYTWQTAAV
jgi:hypothetical protein